MLQNQLQEVHLRKEHQNQLQEAEHLSQLQEVGLLQEADQHQPGAELLNLRLHAEVHQNQHLQKEDHRLPGPEHLNLHLQEAVLHLHAEVHQDLHPQEEVLHQEAEPLNLLQEAAQRHVVEHLNHHQEVAPQAAVLAEV